MQRARGDIKPRHPADIIRRPAGRGSEHGQRTDLLQAGRGGRALLKAERMISRIMPSPAFRAIPVASTDHDRAEKRIDRTLPCVLLDQQRRFALGAEHGLAVGNKLRAVAKHRTHQLLDAFGYQVFQVPHIGSVHGGILHFGAQQIHPEVRVWKIMICCLDVIGYVY